MRNISDILRDERIKQGLSIEDVVDRTKIRKSFIVAIERGDFKALPSDTYAMGFVKNYAVYLGISEDRAAALLRREYEAKKIEVMPKFRKTARPGRKIMLRSPKGYLIIAVILVVFSYIAYQFSFLFFGPKLTVKTPKEGAKISSNVVQVAGVTDPYATVAVNDEDVYVDLTGSFKKTLYVYTGDNKVKIVAKNRSGRETAKTIHVTVK